MKTVKKYLKISIAFGGISLLAGCTGMSIGEPEYACSGIPDGLRCASAQQVYQMTDTDDYKERIEENAMIAKRVKELAGADISPQELQRRIAAEMSEHPASSTQNANQPSITAFEDQVMPGVVPYPVRKVLPLRTPAKVMRVAMRAWESTDGALHVPGYVYTEIEPRRWQIGDREVDMTSKLTAVQVMSAGTSVDGRDAKQKLANGLAAGAREAAYGVENNAIRNR